MTWAQRLKREFKIDIETCRHYGGTILQIHCEADVEAFVLQRPQWVSSGPSELYLPNDRFRG